MKNKAITLISYNRHKYAEYQHLFKSLPLKLEPLDSSFKGLLLEEGETFEANAIQKVTQIPIENQFLFAEDSGLVIEALNGAPGIYSRRFSGLDDAHANNQKVLKLMENVTDRLAYFVAVIALKDPSGEITLFKGECPGYIHTVEAGTTGHGYDPIFIPIGYAETFAEMGTAEKSKISHRHRAALKLIEHLKTHL